MLSGSLKGSAVVNGICRGALCPERAVAVDSPARSRTSGKERFMEVYSSIGARGGIGLMIQEDFMHATGRDFGDDECARVTAVDAVDGLELPQLLPGLAELPEDPPVQLHHVDLAGDGPRGRRLAVGVRVGNEEVLVGSRRDAELP